MKLHLDEWGRGDRTALLIHGLSNSNLTWIATAEALVSRGYRVLAPDLRGHGRSPRGAYSVAEWAEDLVDSLPRGADVALGHSLGGVALLLAGERLLPKRAIYEDPAWLLPAAIQPAVRASFASRRTQTREDVAAANPTWVEEDVANRHAGFQRWDAATVDGFLTGAEIDHTPTTPPTRPSLVLLADPSDLVPPANAERLRQLGWQVEAIPGTRHMVHLDAPNAFIEAVLRFAEGAE